LTQPAISLPLRPNIPIIHQSWDWYRITQPGAHPASPDGLTSTAGIAIASATAASLICGRPPTEASPFSRWLDNVICFRSSFARLNLWFTYYCVLVVPVTRVIYYIVLFYVYRVRKTHFIVFFLLVERGVWWQHILQHDTHHFQPRYSQQRGSHPFRLLLSRL
jgi:hypothetical protein